MKESTGAFIDLNRDEGKIIVRGNDTDAVAKAAAQVSELLKSSGGVGGSGATGGAEKRITVDRRNISAVIGAGGATVRGIQDETGARITIDKVTGSVDAFIDGCII